MNKKVFIICPVRLATEQIKIKLEKYTKELEDKGIKVHLPHRDTDQTKTGLEICTQNKEAIINSDEVHIFYLSSSTGIHFDLGIAFAFNKPFIIVENELFNEKKSFARFIWENSKNEIN